MDDLKRYLVEEFVEDYAEGRLTRRRALKLIAGLSGGALAARMLEGRAQPAAQPAAKAPAVSPDHVAPDDPAVVAAWIEFASGDAQIEGYLARPSKPGRFPIVLISHENRGVTLYIEDVARRLAKTGYVALAVNLVSREGGSYKLDYDRIPALLGAAPPGRFVQDFQAGLAYARAQPFARAERAGMVGFCFGSGVVWRVAAATPELRAVVPFYGVPVAAAEAPKINAAVLAIYAGRDRRVNRNIPAIEAAMQQNGKTFRKIMYPDVDHAFHNDTGERYNAAAASAAWKETLEWFGKYLGA